MVDGGREDAADGARVAARGFFEGGCAIDAAGRLRAVSREAPERREGAPEEDVMRPGAQGRLDRAERGLEDLGPPEMRADQLVFAVGEDEEERRGRARVVAPIVRGGDEEARGLPSVPREELEIGDVLAIEDPVRALELGAC